MPTHASWLNQIETYFSILPRRALTPMETADRLRVTERVLCYQEHHNQTAKLFDWKFTHSDLQQKAGDPGRHQVEKRMTAKAGPII